jgi:hypothetical protein
MRPRPQWGRAGARGAIISYKIGFLQSQNFHLFFAKNFPYTNQHGKNEKKFSYKNHFPEFFLVFMVWIFPEITTGFFPSRSFEIHVEDIRIT